MLESCLVSNGLLEKSLNRACHIPLLANVVPAIKNKMRMQYWMELFPMSQSKDGREVRG